MKYAIKSIGHTYKQHRFQKKTRRKIENIYRNLIIKQQRHQVIKTQINSAASDWRLLVMKCR